MRRQLITSVLLIYFSIALFGQESTINQEKKAKKKSSIQFQGDSRRTFVNRESVGIFGARLGVMLQEKVEVGLGVYSSNLFGILGRAVRKNYQDNSITPSLSIPSDIGFHYFSIYGEYTIINNDRLIFTANSQLGLGWVDIDFVEPHLGKESKRENKSLVEHSLKVDVKTLEWFRLIGGIGYRYLLSGEPQIKQAFNAPIYIVGFSVDFKNLFNKIFKKNQ